MFCEVIFMISIEVLADLVMPISEIKKNPMSLADEAKIAPVAVLNRNKPVLYCLSPDMYAELIGKIEDAELAITAMERLADQESPVKVTLDEL